MMKYEVLGLPDRVGMYGFATYTECVAFLKRYTRSGNWGGYEAFAIIDKDDNTIVTLEVEDERAVWRYPDVD